MSDILTPALFGLALVLVWRSISTSMATALSVVAVVEMAYTTTPVVNWYTGPIFHGQAFLVFSCVALLVVHIRLGDLAAHRVWQTTSVALVIAFLLVSKFEGGLRADHRMWASSLAQYIIVGGIGQVIWRRFHVVGPLRYSLTLGAFPLSSILHSFLAFDPPSLWATSAVAASYYGALFLSGVYVAEHYWNTGTASQRLEQSLTEIKRGGQDTRGVS